MDKLYTKVSFPLGVELPNPFREGRYVYMEDLRILDSKVPPQELPKVPVKLAGVVTPQRTKVWEQYLRALLDKECAQYLVKGLSQGFRIGFDYT